MAVVDESSKAPPGDPGGASWWAGSVSVLPPGAGPDEGVAVALLVVEEVGVNRRVERRIVQLDREVIATLGGALRPGGPDLGAPDIDPMTGALSFARWVSGTMRTFLVCTLRVTISPWNSLPNFVKEPMLAMSLLLGCIEPATTAASMAIGKPEADRRRTPRGLERSGGWRR